MPPPPKKTLAGMHLGLCSSFPKTRGKNDYLPGYRTCPLVMCLPMHTITFMCVCVCVCVCVVFRRMNLVVVVLGVARIVP